MRQEQERRRQERLDRHSLRWVPVGHKVPGQGASSSVEAAAGGAAAYASSSWQPSGQVHSAAASFQQSLPQQ